MNSLEGFGVKGIILAGGTGSRLHPLTALINKHLLPVGPYPMIYYGIEKLKNAGIENILLVIGKQSAGLYMDFFGSGSEFGVKLTYKIQDEAGGIAQALAQAEGFINKDDKFVVLLGDNLFTDDLTKYVTAFRNESGAKVFVKRVSDPHRYGVPAFEGDRITHIEEKPANPKSNYCVTGIYMYDGSVFEIIRQLKPSARGELEITDVNNKYAAIGKLSSHTLQGWWSDAGTFSSLLEATEKMTEWYEKRTKR